MTAPILHYVYDPLCGWCYAAEPLVEAAAEVGVSIVLHGGGLWDPGVHAPEAKRRSMRETDARIAQLTGQAFGEAYLEGLLVDPASLWWSRPTVAAVLAAESLKAGGGLAMIAAVQRAHYVEGRRVVENAVLADAAGAVGLDPARFTQALQAAPVDAHIQATRRLMQGYGLQGFPSFLLERDGHVARLPHEACYGRPADFVAAVQTAAGTSTRQATAWTQPLQQGDAL